MHTQKHAHNKQAALQDWRDGPTAGRHLLKLLDEIRRVTPVAGSTDIRGGIGLVRVGLHWT